jgi:hypothetical protein
MTLIADPHKISRTQLSRPVPPGPSSRWLTAATPLIKPNEDAFRRGRLRTGTPTGRAAGLAP